MFLINGGVWSYGARSFPFGIESYLRVETASFIHGAPEQKTHGLSRLMFLIA